MGVSLELCKHLDRFKKAQRPNEQRFSLDSRTVFLSQTWKIIHALEQEVDAAYWVVKIAVDSTDIGVPTDGFTVVDDNGCIANNTAVINAEDALQAVIDETHVSCNGNCDASMQVIPSGGVAPYTYSDVFFIFCWELFFHNFALLDHI